MTCARSAFIWHAGSCTVCTQRIMQQCHSCRRAKPGGMELRYATRRHEATLTKQPHQASSIAGSCTPGSANCAVHAQCSKNCTPGGSAGLHQSPPQEPRLLPLRIEYTGERHGACVVAMRAMRHHCRHFFRDGTPVQQPKSSCLGRQHANLAPCRRRVQPASSRQRRQGIAPTIIAGSHLGLFGVGEVLHSGTGSKQVGRSWAAAATTAAAE